MTGPEHYAEAERLADQLYGDEQDPRDVAALAAVAQVHATLALAAATALNLSLDDYQAWARLAALTESGQLVTYSPSKDGR